jgi:PST family polysaccharide transporter
MAAFTANQAPRILIGYLFGPAALGAFSLGLRIVEMMYQLMGTPAVNVVVSVIAKWREEPERLQRTVLIATQFTAMVTAPVFVALALTSPYLVPLVFGAKWTASVPIIQILCLYGVVVTCGLIWGAIIGGLGRPDVTLLTTSSAAIVSVTVLLIAAPWGLVPAAAAFVVRGYLTLPFMPLIIARLTGIRASAQYAVFGPVVLASAVMAASIELVIFAFGSWLSPLLMTALTLSVGVLAYVLALCLFARPQLRLGVSFLTQLRPSSELA